MPKTIYQEFSFEPVGQGLFVHGRLYSRDSSESFSWVYDCGTRSSFSALQNRIENVVRRLADKALDLMVLSHYDQDHVNGVVEFVKGSSIKTLVLPYLYPAQRALLLAQASGMANWYQSFLESPASFFLRAGDGRIGRVVLVESGGELPNSEAGGIAPTEWPPDDQVRARFRKPESFDSAILGDTADNDFDLNNGRIRLTNCSAPLSVFGGWEFCFWNRPQDLTHLKTWWNGAEPVWRKFQASKKAPQDYEELIGKMRAALTTNPRLPKKLFSANEVSLQCYNGPIHRGLDSNATHRAHIEIPGGSLVPFWWSESLISLCPSPVAVPYDGGFLFTGDITMDSEVSSQLETFLGDQRWQSLTYLQVPHHGARRSWRAGVYDTWMHRVSVFSAAGSGSGYGHPHPEVVDDLEDRSPIHVSLKNGFVGGGIFHFS